jgi:hypothetical protein
VTAFVYWLGTIQLVALVVTARGVPTLHYSTECGLPWQSKGYSQLRAQRSYGIGD